MHFEANLCPVCKTYQDWRRYLTFGQTTLALLVALVSVSTAAIPVIVDALGSDNSRLIFAPQDARGITLSVLASNLGNRAGSVASAELSVGGSVGDQVLIELYAPEPRFGGAFIVQPGASIMLDFEAASLIGSQMAESAEKCVLRVQYTNFDGITGTYEFANDCGLFRGFLRTLSPA